MTSETHINQPDLESTLRLMARVGSCSSPTFSPDGQQLAFVSNLSGVPQVWLVPVTGGWPRMITSLEDPVTSVSWSPDGAKLALLVAPGYCWCGHFRTQHLSEAVKVAEKIIAKKPG